MSSVDSRIVTMKFDNAQFEQGAKTTMGTMEKLKTSLNFTGAAKGLGELQAGANKFNLNEMDSSVNKVQASFSAMSVIAITALSNIASKAIEVGLDMVKSLTLDPILAGFDEYELKMNSIQTIMAGSGESLDVVNGKLQELNDYADQTIYSFADMTSNIGKFTNAGVDLDTSIAAIQGVANAAALSGANSNEASRAMYNFAQSISSGSVKLQDWKSIELANMATVEFKNQLLESAVATGTLTKGVDGMYTTLEGTPISATKGFNESLQEQWLTSEALIETLGNYSDTTTDIGQRATAAATEVKTFSHLMDTLRETAGSGWAQTFEIIFGNFEEAKQLWTGINETIGGMLDDAADARNLMFQDWKDAGGRTALIDGLTAAFDALMIVVHAVGDAFRTIFPKTTGDELASMTEAFRDFANGLKLSEETAQNLQSTLQGVFAVFGIVWEIVKGVVGVFFDLIGATTGVGGGILKVTGTIGEFLTSVHQALVEGELFSNFFDTLGAILAVPIDLLGILANFIGDIFSGVDIGAADSATSALGGLSDRLESVTGFAEGFADAIVNTFNKIADFLAPVVNTITSAIGDIWDSITEAFSTGNFSTVLDTINTGLFGALVLGIRKFLKGFGDLSFKDMFSSFNGALDELTGVLTTMQTNIKADTLMKIAIAVGVLAASLVLLASMDSDKLAGAAAALTGLFVELLVAMKILEIITKSKGFYKMPFIAASMILLSTAILILSFAMRSMANMSWEELARGLAGVAGALLVLSIAIKPLSANSRGMVKAAFGILVLSGALVALSLAVRAFGSMDLATMAKGLVGIAAGIVVVSFAIRLMPKNILKTAISLGILGVSLKILASAVGDFGAMDLVGVGKGLLGVAGALVVIGVAMRLMPKNMLITAAGLILVSIALKGISEAVLNMGQMSWEEIAKGLIVLAGSLTILAIALIVMSGTLAGSAALLIAAAAISVLTVALIALGGMSWQEILTALITLAAALALIAGAAILLTPVIPLIAALGAAVGLLAGAMLLAGLAAVAFSTALAILVGLGAAAAIVMGQMLDVIISSIPKALKAFGEGIVAFAGAIAEGGPQFVAAMTTVLTSMLQAIIDTMPKFREAMTAIVETLIEVMVEHIPDLAAAGYDMLLAVLHEIEDNIQDVVDTALGIIEGFLRGIAQGIPGVIDAAFEVIVAFIDGIADGIDDHSEELKESGRNLARSIVDGMTGGLGDGIGKVVGKAKELASSAVSAVKGVFDSSSPSKVFYAIGKDVDDGLALGLEAYSSVVEGSAEGVANATIDTMKASMAKISEVMAQDVDYNPTITPVLDLSAFRRDAAKMDALVPSTTVAANASRNQASAISGSYKSAQGTVTETGESGAAVIRFEQNNYSPKALSSVEIYRQTKNQLSLAKEALSA